LLLSLSAGCGEDDSDDHTRNDATALDDTMDDNTLADDTGGEDTVTTTTVPTTSTTTTTNPGVWVDPDSGLMWQVVSTSGVWTWSEAATYCEKMNLGGYTDWHLPSILLLTSLIRGCNWWNVGSCAPDNGPADGCYWPTPMQGECNTYWSSTLEGGYFALTTNFNRGVPGISPTFDLFYGVMNHNYARCVRFIQPRINYF